MKRIVLLLILASGGVLWAAHDVDTTKTLAQASRADLFKLIFDVNQAALDSSRIWLAEHRGKPSVTEDELFDEMLETVRARLVGLEANHRARHAPPEPAPTFGNPTGSWDGRCPDCVRLGLRSTVRLEFALVTAMHCGFGHYGEDGTFHPPKPCNWVTTSYSCSQGHGFEQRDKVL